MTFKDNTKALFYRLSSIILVITALFFSVVFFVNISNGKYPDNSIEITGAFDIIANGQEYKGVDIGSVQLNPTKKGDHYELSFIMPATELRNPVMSLYVDHSAIKVYFNDEIVFEKGDKSSRMLGYGYYNIKLPENYAGMKVRIVYDCIESEGLTEIPRPVICDSTVQLHNFIADNALYVNIDLSIVVSCMIIMLVGIIFSGTMLSLSRLVFLGTAFFMMGLWELCSYNMLSIFTDSLIMKGYVEYTSLYLGPFFLAVYFYFEFISSESALIKRIYGWITFLQGGFFVVAYILHFLDIAHLPALLQYYHGILIVNILTLLIVLAKQVIRRDHSHRSMVVGLIIVVTLTAIDLLRFVLGKYVFGEELRIFKSYMLFGFFFFMIALIIDFLINQRRNLYKVAQAEAMDRLAHIDIMTNLANRRKCEEVFDELLNTEKIFDIISLDLNYLKATNDKYGHQEGDRLLTDFAGIMVKACEGYDVLPGRMGGDEFIIIIPDASAADYEVITGRLDKLRDEINVNRRPVSLSFAYGVCRSDDEKLLTPEEGETIVEAAYRIADERMYDMKTAMKARREDQGL